MEPGNASFPNALRPTGLLIAGKAEVAFVEKLRFDAARHVWRSIDGLIKEAIMKPYSY
jgi:hypothetical protein